MLKTIDNSETVTQTSFVFSPTFCGFIVKNKAQRWLANVTSCFGLADMSHGIFLGINRQTKVNPFWIFIYRQQVHFLNFS